MSKSNFEVHIKHLKVLLKLNWWWNFIYCVCAISLNFEIYFLKFLWENASGVISGFSRQKFGSRIILSILQSFLHFLKGKYINNCPKWHSEQFPMGTRENKFQSSENLCKHRQNFKCFVRSSTFVFHVWCG